MKTNYLVAAVVMGLDFSTAGCSSATDAELAAMDLEAPHYAAQENPNGGSTSNHFAPSIYHAHKYELLAAMGYALGPLTDVDGSDVYGLSLSSSIYSTGILGTPEGQDLFGAAIECALADGKSVSQSNPSRTYTGKGLMRTTAGWSSSPLSNDQKEDVFRCVVARINAFGVSVPIVISGQNVTNQPDEDHSTANWQPDALFDAQITWSGGVPSIQEYAWSLASGGTQSGTTSTQSPSVVSAMEARVCDSSPATCGFQVLDAVTSGCYQYPGPLDGTSFYQCSIDGLSTERPVVEAWADANGLVDL